MAFSTAAEAIAAINASNLTDGQQIKQLLDDLVTFLSAAAGNVPAATTSTAGVVKQAAHMAALSAAPTQDDFNTLLTNLQSAGLMA